ncbi:dihydrofolate reductase family protein [Desulfobacter latus]|uniref:Dihydrofolate reductase n=1 Tax=Desulfobacter latus TaxID=2292 RepID=A0A850T5M9_9BACT|nr:dihydrofolate reductase family protein [Desulfobacter latus]NWH06401.1 dihydrofolate reductase [Desulfobacter latus]
MEVILLMASTVDGIIAKNSSQVVDWTGKADKKYYVEVTKKAGVMIMGSNTYDSIGRPLPGRLNVVMTRDKSRQSDQDNLIFTDLPPAGILEDLERKGYTSVALVGGATVNTLFIRENLITQIHLTLVPRLFGSGLSLFAPPLDLDLEVSLTSTKDLGDGHILLIYHVGNRQLPLG